MLPYRGSYIITNTLPILKQGILIRAIEKLLL